MIEGQDSHVRPLREGRRAEGHRALSKSEREMIDGLSDRMRPLAHLAYEKIAKLCIGAGCYPIVIDGTRTDARALKIWSHGRKITGPNPTTEAKSWTIVNEGEVRTRAFPGSSAHRGPNGGSSGGDAVDIALFGSSTRDWLEGGGKPDPRWTSIVAKVADELGLVWGGRFRDQRGRLFFDGAHLQHHSWVKP